MKSSQFFFTKIWFSWTNVAIMSLSKDQKGRMSSADLHFTCPRYHFLQLHTIVTTIRWDGLTSTFCVDLRYWLPWLFAPVMSNNWRNISCSSPEQSGCILFGTHECFLSPLGEGELHWISAQLENCPVSSSSAVKWTVCVWRSKPYEHTLHDELEISTKWRELGNFWM